MAKNTNFKNNEPLEVRVKRCLLNGMTMTDVEKYLKISRNKVRLIYGQVTQEDKKTLIGSGLQDCVPKSSQQLIENLLKTGKTSKSISQLFNLPVRVINAIGESHIERVLENIETKEEVPLVESVVYTAAEPPKRPGRKSNVDMEMCELLYNEHMSGKTYTVLSKEYGMTASMLGYYINRYRNANNLQNIRHANSGKDVCRTTSHSNASLTDDMVVKIAKMIMDGESNIDISLETGVETYKIADIKAKKTYKYITKDYDFPVRDMNFDYFSDRHGLTREKFDKIIELIMAGKSNKAISEEISVSDYIIRNIRSKNTFKRFTKNLVFPDQVSMSFNKRKSNESITKTTTIDSNIKSQASFNAQNDTSVINDTTNHELITETKENHSVIEIGTHKYFANIAKAFAADKFSAILVKNSNMIVYGVENSVKSALLRVISLATPVEISGCDVYIAGADKIDEEIITAVKSLGVGTIIITK